VFEKKWNGYYKFKFETMSPESDEEVEFKKMRMQANDSSTDSDVDLNEAFDPRSDD